MYLRAFKIDSIHQIKPLLVLAVASAALLLFQSCEEHLAEEEKGIGDQQVDVLPWNLATISSIEIDPEGERCWTLGYTEQVSAGAPCPFPLQLDPRNAPEIPTDFLVKLNELLSQNRLCYFHPPTPDPAHPLVCTMQVHLPWVKFHWLETSLGLTHDNCPLRGHIEICDPKAAGQFLALIDDIADLVSSPPIE